MRVAVVVFVSLSGSAACLSTFHGGVSRTSAWSGTRIRARVLVSEDGARLRVGWWDADRNEECSFRRAEDGKIRCLPTALAVALAFTDEACGTAFVEIRGPVAQECGTPLPAYCVEVDRDGCGSTRLWPVVGTREDFDRYCRRGSGNTSCRCFEEKTSGMRLGDALPAMTFAEATFALEGDGRLASRALKTVDGATEWLGFYDRAIGASCTFAQIDETTAACIPTPLSMPFGSSVSLGADCLGTDPDAVRGPCEGYAAPAACAPSTAPSETRFEVRGPECAGMPTVRRVGGEAPGDHSVSSYNKGTSRSSCDVVAACALEADVGPLLERRKLATADGSVGGDVQSGWRLVAHPPGERRCWKPGVDVDALPRWRDNVLDLDCELVAAHDGVTRCIPPVRRDVHADRSFTDADCKKPFATFETPPATSPVIVALPGGQFNLPGAAGCVLTRAAYRAEPISQAKKFVLRTPTECVALDADGPRDGWSLSLMPPEEFVSAKLVTE